MLWHLWGRLYFPSKSCFPIKSAYFFHFFFTWIPDPANCFKTWATTSESYVTYLKPSWTGVILKSHRNHKSHTVWQIKIKSSNSLCSSYFVGCSKECRSAHLRISLAVPLFYSFYSVLSDGYRNCSSLLYLFQRNREFIILCFTVHKT